MEGGELGGPSSDDPSNVSIDVWVPDVECDRQMSSLEYIYMPISQFLDHLSLVSDPPE